jgi:pachytene checkpoint protein 2
MATPVLINPTLHVEVQLTSTITSETQKTMRAEVSEWLHGNYVTVQVGPLGDHDVMKHSKIIRAVSVADFTGPKNATGFFSVEGTALDIQIYMLRPENDTSDRRSIKQADEVPQARMLALPNTTLDNEWDSLVFEDALPARLLRYLVRMIAMMGQAGLNLSTFNWNRLCLLHGPPGSGKSTLCRAIAQKLSIRLGDMFVSSVLVEVNANAMLSKYFGESGKLIESTFESVRSLARDRNKLVVVVIDEVETIAGSRRAASNNGECNDGLRVWT